MPQVKILLLALCLLLPAAVCRGMEVRSDPSRNEYTMYLTGQIVPGDLAKIVAAVAGPAGFPKYFTLESPGGDVAEAMAIGRFIRDTASGTVVARQCASACVLVLMAGVSRQASDTASVGLHRPYYHPRQFAGLSLPDAEAKHKALRIATRRYLEDMEMPTAFIEKMFSISSDDVYYLSPQEKARLLVPPSAYTEWIRAKCSPPTAQELQLFAASGFNYFDRYNNSPPTNPAFWAYINKMDKAEACETDVVRSLRKEALRKYVNR